MAKAAVVFSAQGDTVFRVYVRKGEKVLEDLEKGLEEQAKVLAGSGMTGAQILATFEKNLENATDSFAGVQAAVSKMTDTLAAQTSQLASNATMPEDELYLWVLDPAAKEHCGDCVKRSGEGAKSLLDWEEVGLPGLGNTECDGYCKCTLVPVAPQTESYEEKGGGNLPAPSSTAADLFVSAMVDDAQKLFESSAKLKAENAAKLSKLSGDLKKAKAVKATKLSAAKEFKATLKKAEEAQTAQAEALKMTRAQREALQAKYVKSLKVMNISERYVESNARQIQVMNLPYTKYELAIIQQYTANQYAELNKALATGTATGRQKTVRDIFNQGLRNAKPVSAKVVWRGIRKKGLAYQVGETYSFEAFQSTSTSESFARSWSRGHSLFVIKHRSAVDVTRISSTGRTEYEAILPAGTKMKLLKKETGADGLEIFFWTEV